MINEIENPYICVEIQEDSLNYISNSISKFLTELKIPFQKGRTPHISLAYVLGPQFTDHIQSVISDISESSFSVKAIGITLLEGKVTGKDYIALELETESDFGYAHDYICENCEVKKIGDKFIAHLSLFELEQGIIPQADWFTFCRVLELFSNNVIAGKIIRGKKISVFNQNRQKELSVSFSD